MTPESHRRRIQREAKRRQRARHYKAGLDHKGHPRSGAVVWRAGAVGSHPTGCLCRDCLWGEPAAYVKPRCRVVR